MAQTVTISDVYAELKVIAKKMVTKEELAQALETIEILANPQTIEQIKESEQDIRRGRVREIKSVRDI